MTNETDVADIKFSQRFSANLVTNIVYTVCNALIGVLLVPYYLETIGNLAYGIIPVATSFISYVVLVMSALNVSIGRYLTFDLRASDVNKANQTFNTALFVLVIIVAILTPLAILLSLSAPSLFNTLGLSTVDVTGLFLGISLATLLTVLGGGITQTLFAKNLFYVRNTLLLSQVFLQVVFIVVFFNLFQPSLLLVGIAYLLAALIYVVFSLVSLHVFSKEFTISRRYVSKDRFKDLLSMTLWTLVQNAGMLLRFNIGILVVNIVCGLLAGTYYSIIVSFYSLLIAAVAMLTSLFGPLVFSYVSKNDFTGLKNFYYIALKVTCLTSALLLGIIFVYAPEILRLWVGEQYVMLAPLVYLSVIPVYFYAPINFVSTALVANLRHKQYGIIYCLFGVFMIPLSIILTILFGISGVLIAGIIISVLCDFIVMVFYASRLIRDNTLRLYANYIYGIFLTPIIVIIGYLVKHVFLGDTIISLILGCLSITIITIPIVLFIFLRKSERKLIRPCLPKFIQLIIPKWIL